jgi:hypothetical protein
MRTNAILLSFIFQCTNAIAITFSIPKDYPRRLMSVQRSEGNYPEGDAPQASVAK